MHLRNSDCNATVFVSMDLRVQIFSEIESYAILKIEYHLEVLVCYCSLSAGSTLGRVADV